MCITPYLAGTIGAYGYNFANWLYYIIIHNFYTFIGYRQNIMECRINALPVDAIGVLNIVCEG